MTPPRPIAARPAHLAHPGATGAAGRGRAAGWEAGRAPAAALLEVLLALALFFGVAIGVMGGLGTSIKAARDLRLEAEAADMAVTLLSEIELGIVAAEEDGPTEYEEPLEDWTWQVAVTPVTSTLTDLVLTRIEVVIRNVPEDYTYRLYRLRTEEDETLAAAEETMPGFAEGEASPFGTGGGGSSSGGGGRSRGGAAPPGEESP